LKDLAELYFYRKEYNQGIEVVQKSISISKKHNLNVIENDALINLSWLLRVTNQLDKALGTVNLVIKNLEEKKHVNLLLRAKKSKASILSKLNRIDEAIDLTHQVMIVTQQHNLQKQSIQFHNCLAKFYGKKEDFKTAFYHQNKAKQIKNFILKTEKAKIIKLAENSASVESKSIKEQISKSSYYGRLTNIFGYSIAIFLWVGLLLILIFRKFDNSSPELKNAIHLFKENHHNQNFHFAKKVSFWSFIMLLPIIFHFYYWNLIGAMLIIILLSMMSILILFFANKKNMEGIFYVSMTPYFVFAITPLMIGHLDSIPFCIVVTFIINCFLIPKKFYQIVNVSFACISTLGYFYYQTYGEKISIPFSTELNILITLMGIILLIGKITFYFKNLNNLKRQLFENIDFLNQISDINPHFIFTKNKNREFTFVNEALAKVYQIDKSNLIGKKDEDIDDFFNNHHHFREDDMAVLNKGISVVKREEYIIPKNGKNIWLETTKKPIRDKHNNVIGIYGMANNITKKKEAERKTIESEKRYCQIFNHSFDSLLIINTNGEIIDSNQNAISFFGFPNKETLLKNNIWKIFPEEQNQVDLKELCNSRIKYCLPIVGNAIDTNGKNIPVENSIFKIKIEDTNQIIWATKDISKKIELKKKEKELLDKQIELQQINNELVSQTISKNHNNKFLEEIEKNLKSIIPSIQNKEKNDIQKLIRKIGNEKNSNDNFYEFKLKFEKSHSNFFKKLFAINPKLTQTDLKISAYIKLGMTPQDIANILSIEKKSVEMAKYRLKKKIKLTKEEDLNTFILKL